MGRTDAQGRYTLIYPGSVEGAVIGEHQVTITTFVGENPDDEPPTERVAEKIPAIYNVKTTLTQKVEKGSNTIDFPLESKGEIIQPDQGETRTGG